MAKIARNNCQICGAVIHIRGNLHSGITCSKPCYDIFVRWANWEYEQWKKGEYKYEAP